MGAGETAQIHIGTCGDGVFAQALGEMSFHEETSFTGFEILKEEARRPNPGVV